MSDTNNKQDPAPKAKPAARKFTPADAVDALTLYGKGVVSSLTLKNPIQLFKKNSDIRDHVKKCVCYNGGILFGCIVLFRLFVLPFMNRCFPPTVVPGDVEGETREINSWPTSIVTFLYSHVVLGVVWIVTKALDAPSFTKICETFNSCSPNPRPIPAQNDA